MGFVRELGKDEKILAKLNQFACTWNIVIVSRIKGSIKEDILCQAFDLVRQRHPILNCRIIQSSKTFYFEKFSEAPPPIPLRVVNHFKGCIWEDIVQQELNLKINHQEGLLRAVLVYPFEEHDITYLVTSLHHAASDGQSSMQLHAELFTYCQQIMQGLPITLDANDHPLPILHPVETFLPPWTRGLKGFFNSQLYILRLILEKSWYRPKTLKVERYVPLESRHCNIIHRQLAPYLTKALIATSKMEETTVHAALCAAMILTAMRKINSDNHQEICISCKSSVNLRKRLPIPIREYQMGMFASLLVTYTKVQKNINFWDLARAVKRKLELPLQRKDDYRMLLVSGFLYRYLSIFPWEVTSSVHISNVGKVSIPRNYDAFTLEEISFATANRLYGGTYTVEATTFQEALSLNFVFVEPLIAKSTMDELIDDTMSQIAKICQTSVESEQILD